MASKKLTKGELLDQIATFRPGAGTIIVAMSTPAMRKTNNPFYGRVTKVTKMTGVQLGTDFQSAKENSAKRSGCSFVAVPATVAGDPRRKNMEYVNRMVLVNKETGEHYLPVQWTNKSVTQGFVQFDSCFLLDNQPMTHSEFKHLQEFLQDSGKDYVPTDQRNFNEEEIRNYITLKLENVFTIQQGSKLLRLK